MPWLAVRVRRLQLGVLTVVLGSVLGWGSTWSEAAATTTTEPAVPVVVGHRGANLPHRPESALSTLRYAADWADIVEVDLQWTRDGVPVVMHDTTLNRTTSCRGAVAARPWSEVRRCRLTRTGRRASDWSPGAAIEAVPSFAQVLTVMRNADRHRLMVQIGPPSLSDTQAREFVALIRRARMADRTVLESMYPANLDQIRRVGGADLATTYLMRGFATTMPPVETVRRYGGIVMPRYVHLRRAQVVAYQQVGVQVWAWTATTPEETAAILALGVDGVFTDDPEGLRRRLTTPSEP